MVKVLWMTDSPYSPSGYGIMGRNILKRLVKAGHEVHAVGLNHMEGKVKVEDGYWVHPRYVDPHGFDILGGYIKQLKPDVLITVKDIGLQAGYVPTVEKLRKEGFNFKWYGYCPIDSKTVTFDWVDVFKAMDKVIAMSEWSAKMIKEQAGIDSITIPGGVDTELFKPFTESEKEEVRKDKAFSSAFVIGTNGRNQYRKMWNKLIKGYSIFCKDKIDTMLLFHCDVSGNSASDGWDWRYLGVKYDCESKMQPTFANLNAGTRFWVSDEDMVRIYNNFDIFAFSTGGEGFGVPILEAMSCGLPVATTAFTTGFELVEGHGELIDVTKDKYGDGVFWEGQNGVEFAIPDERSVAEKLQKLYDSWKGDKKLIKEYSEKSREHALKYDWDKAIIPLWIKLITEQPSQRK